ncbi:MAG: HAD family phosphatase [Firmicutes bacterium]|nr:HAD family phosphatase [Bacillota bacterium]
MKYKCIALDMDGTLLNSDKKISEKTRLAIEEAAKMGKIIVLNTGRGVSELSDFREILKDVRYANCLSGGLVYDFQEEKAIFSQELPYTLVQELFPYARLEECMIHCLSKESYVEQYAFDHMERYHMDVYKDHFRRLAIKLEDLQKAHKEQRFIVHKFNMYHNNQAGRDRSRARLVEKGYPVELVDAETTSLEITQKGIDKGNGLRKLGEYLGFTMDELIVVGDADNDLAALKVAGLAVAMGNSNENVRKVCDVIVADNDHDGVAQAIQEYLLKE